jgi:hypothetical protein
VYARRVLDGDGGTQGHARSQGHLMREFMWKLTASEKQLCKLFL